MVYGITELDLILLLLVNFPCLLSIALLLGDPLVFLLKSLELGCLFLTVFILKHASHSSNNSGLFCVGSLLIDLGLDAVVVLLSLLLDPCLLLGGLKGKSLVIKEIFAFELTAA